MILSTMSLGIALKGTEGIVLAADSRVTLFGQVPSLGPQQLVIPAAFDNATKILKTGSQQYVAAVTFGAGVIGAAEPRTASSFMPEFEAEVSQGGRLTVRTFAEKLGDFFNRQWKATGMASNPPLGENMVFMVAGYDENAPYGDLYGVNVPSSPSPAQLIPTGGFGAMWGGQREMTDRLIQGFDPSLPEVVQDLLAIPPANRDASLAMKLRGKLGIAIPWQFLPLQDCVDLSIFLVRTTIVLQKWVVGVRGVGGAVDVVTITRTDGIKEVQVKQISGEKL
jgi:hypothetical protein